MGWTPLIDRRGPQNYLQEPTRGPNCIDLIYTNSCDATSFGTVNVNISDHELIYFSKKNVTSAKKHVDFWRRSYRNYNCERFQASQGMALEPLKSTRQQGHFLKLTCDIGLIDTGKNIVTQHFLNLTCDMTAS